MTIDIKKWQSDFEKLPGRVDRKNYTVTNYYKYGKLIATFSPVPGSSDLEHLTHAAEDRAAAEMSREDFEKYAGAKESVFNEVAFNTAREEAIIERKNFWDNFKQAVFTEAGVSGHPKAEKLWEIVFENRKGEGLQALLDEAEELSELMK